MFGSFPPSPLVGLRLQSLLGPGSRHCYGIITLKTESERHPLNRAERLCALASKKLQRETATRRTRGVRHTTYQGSSAVIIGRRSATSRPYVEQNTSPRKPKT